MKLLQKLNKIKNHIPIIFLSLFDKKTPIFSKIIITLTIIYIINPFDLSLDYVPIIGLIDDALLLYIIMKINMKLIPDDVIKENKEKLDRFFKLK